MFVPLMKSKSYSKDTFIKNSLLQSKHCQRIEVAWASEVTVCLAASLSCWKELSGVGSSLERQDKTLCFIYFFPILIREKQNKTKTKENKKPDSSVSLEMSMRASQQITRPTLFLQRKYQFWKLGEK